MPESWCLFIALELPPNLRRNLSELQDTLRQQLPPRAIRWVKPDGIHLTLKFLGDVPRDKHAAISDRVHAIARTSQPLQLATADIGCFPNLTRPRVVWIGIQGKVEALSTIHNTFETELEQIGFPSEKRQFSPHLTLGRLQRSVKTDVARLIGRIIKNFPTPHTQNWRAESISLMRSELGKDGARYTPLTRANFASRDNKTGPDESR